MITIKDRIEQFKRDLKSRNYYQAKSNEFDLKLEELHRIMHEPKSIRYGDSIGNGSFSFIDLMEQEDSIKSEAKVFNSMIHSIDERLSRIDSDNDRKMIEDVYCNRINHEKVAKRYGYTRGGMYKHIYKTMAEIF